MLKPGLAFYLASDWRELTVCGWRSVPNAWKKAFSLAFIVACIVYFFDLAQFPLGDHDVGYQDGIPLLSGGRSGRWFAPVLHLVSGHVQVPVYTQIWSFAVQIAAGIGAVLLWRPQADWFVLFVGAVLVSCIPAASDFYYYHFQALSFTASQLFMVLSLHCTLTLSGRRLWRYAAATVLATFALGSYQSSIMTWTSCFWGLLLVRLVQWDGQRDSLRAQIFALCPALFSLMLACALYSISLSLYPLVGLSLELYQFQTLSPAQFLPRFIETAQQAWLHLVVPQGFMSLWLKSLFLLGMAGGSAVLLASVEKPRASRLRVAALLVGIALFPLAAKAQFMVSSSNDWYSYRFLALGVSYIYSFFLVALLTAHATAARNAGLALFALLLPCMTVNNLDQQIRHVRSVEHDLAVLNRVVGRIEALENFDPDKTYNLVQFGRTTPYLQGSPGAGPHSPLENSTVSQAWNPGFELWLLSKYLKLGDRINEDVAKRPDIMATALRHVADKKAFPHQGSVAIVDDIIILLFDAKAIPLAQNRLRSLGK